MFADKVVLCMIGSRAEENKQENEKGLSTYKRNLARCTEVKSKSWMRA